MGYCGEFSRPIPLPLPDHDLTTARFDLLEELREGSKSLRDVRKFMKKLYEKAMRDHNHIFPPNPFVEVGYKTAEEFARIKLNQLENIGWIRQVGKRYELGEKARQYL